MTTRRARRTSLVPISVLMVLAALLLPGPGCAKPRYYKVTDPATNSVYYTQKLRRPMDNKTVTFSDVRSNKTVTLDKVQVDQMERPEYQTATAGLADP